MTLPQLNTISARNAHALLRGSSAVFTDRESSPEHFGSVHQPCSARLPLPAYASMSRREWRRLKRFRPCLWNGSLRRDQNSHMLRVSSINSKIHNAGLPVPAARIPSISPHTPTGSRHFRSDFVDVFRWNTRSLCMMNWDVGGIPRGIAPLFLKPASYFEFLPA